jgi:hypothetical protein
VAQEWEARWRWLASLGIEIGLNDRFQAERMSASGRGRVETSNLTDRTVSVRSEASGTATAALCATAEVDCVDRGYLKVALQMRLAARSAAFISQGERASGPHRLHQRSYSHDLHDAFEVVGQHMETHLGTDTRQPLGQEMSRAHPGFERAERMFDGLPA